MRRKTSEKKKSKQKTSTKQNQYHSTISTSTRYFTWKDKKSRALPIPKWLRSKKSMWQCMGKILWECCCRKWWFISAAPSTTGMLIFVHDDAIIHSSGTWCCIIRSWMKIRPTMRVPERKLGPHGRKSYFFVTSSWNGLQIELVRENVPGHVFEKWTTGN